MSLLIILELKHQLLMLKCSYIYIYIYIGLGEDDYELIRLYLIYIV